MNEICPEQTTTLTKPCQDFGHPSFDIPTINRSGYFRAKKEKRDCDVAEWSVVVVVYLLHCCSSKRTCRKEEEEEEKKKKNIFLFLFSLLWSSFKARGHFCLLFVRTFYFRHINFELCFESYYCQKVFIKWKTSLSFFWHAWLFIG